MVGAKPGEKTKGRTKQFEKPGGFEEALEDFENLSPDNIRDIPTGKLGTLSGERAVNVRRTSEDGRPTLEIYHNNKSTKIRYGAK